MKGQAFVNMPNEKIAEKALNDTNGYLLDEKPLVVQFARSSKPK
jgi:U11/U12 small nuclear ribonucleoprotein SNRNP65